MTGTFEPPLWQAVPASGAERRRVAANNLDVPASTINLVAAEQLSATGGDVTGQVPTQQLEQTDTRQSRLLKSRESQRKSRAPKSEYVTTSAMHSCCSPNI